MVKAWKAGLPEKASYVYVIREGGGDVLERAAHKIGVADNPMKRLKAMQTSNSSHLSISTVFSLPDRQTALLVEAEAHKALEELGLRGEWFHADLWKICAVVGDMKREALHGRA